MTTLYVVLGAVALLLLWYVLTWNSFIRARNKVEEAWSGVDVQLKRRHDLVPNLVDTVRGYAQHEQETLDRVTFARSAALSASGRHQRARAEASLTEALGGGSAPSPSPTRPLRAAESFQRLQAQLAEIEDEIQAAAGSTTRRADLRHAHPQVFPNSAIAAAPSPPTSSSSSTPPPSGASRRSPSDGRRDRPHDARRRRRHRGRHLRSRLRGRAAAYVFVIGSAVGVAAGAYLGQPIVMAAGPVALGLLILLFAFVTADRRAAFDFYSAMARDLGLDYHRTASVSASPLLGAVTAAPSST